MNKKLENYIILLLLVLLITLSSCAKPKIADQPSQPTLADTIANMGKTGKAIGCVFAPWVEECQARRADEKPHQSQDEYLEEINQDFQELDEDLDKSKPAGQE